MTYTIERRQNPPVYIATVHDEFDISRNLPSYFDELRAGLESESTPIDIIVDIREHHFTFNDLLTATKQAIQTRDVNPYLHANAKRLIMVSANKALQLSTDGFLKFGMAKDVKVVETLDDALTLTRN